MARVNHDIEHDSAGGEGRDRPGLLGRGPDRRDPLSISMPLMRIGGLRVRVHWIVLLYATCELVATLPPKGAGLDVGGALIGALLVLVLVREIGRGLLARWLGSAVETVTLWPLGGLNSVASDGVRHPTLCETGGLVTSLVLVPLLAGAALAKGLDPRYLYEFDPLAPGRVLGRMSAAPWLVVLWSAYYANLVVLALNLIPMFPMDMGRIMAARLRGRGATRADEAAARVGMFFALALLVLSIYASTRLIGVAAFGFLACMVEPRRAQPLPGDESEPEEGVVGPEKSAAMAGVAVAITELDRVLDKISREGLPSLTVEERDVLSQETERRRRG